jgi:hypothetical protein
VMRGTWQSRDVQVVPGSIPGQALFLLLYFLLFPAQKPVWMGQMGEEKFRDFCVCGESTPRTPLVPTSITQLRFHGGPLTPRASTSEAESAAQTLLRRPTPVHISQFVPIHRLWVVAESFRRAAFDSSLPDFWASKPGRIWIGRRIQRRAADAILHRSYKRSVVYAKRDFSSVIPQNLSRNERKSIRGS